MNLPGFVIFYCQGSGSEVASPLMKEGKIEFASDSSEGIILFWFNYVFAIPRARLSF